MEPVVVASSLVVDCDDPRRLAEFWSALLGGETVTFASGEYVAVKAPGVLFDFVPVDDAKTVKNRIHLDVASDDVDAAVERALALGATRADDVHVSEHWVVLRDPEGNEFCVLRGMPTGAPWLLPEPRDS